MLVKKHLLAVTLLLLSITSVAVYASPAELYIYLPTDLKPLFIQRALNEACPAFSTAVFGSSREFWRKYRESPPSAVITNGIVFEHLVGFALGLEGRSAGKNAQAYFAVSSQGPPEADFSAKTLGMINYLGRRKNQKFLSRVLGQNVRVKAVTKPRDLLPMLSFGVADLLIVSEHTLEYLKKTSKQELFVKKLSLSSRINLAAFQESLDPSTKKNMVGCLENIKTLSFSSEYFSVDTWVTL
jgi:hypothetical protein